MYGLCWGFTLSPSLAGPKMGRVFRCTCGPSEPQFHGTLHGELSIPISSSVCGVLAILGPCAGSTLHLGKGNKQPRRNSKLSKPRLISSPVCIPHPASPPAWEPAALPHRGQPTLQPVCRTRRASRHSRGRWQRMLEAIVEPVSKAASQQSRCESEAFHSGQRQVWYWEGARRCQASSTHNRHPAQELRTWL